MVQVFGTMKFVTSVIVMYEQFEDLTLVSVFVETKIETVVSGTDPRQNKQNGIK